MAQGPLLCGMLSQIAVEGYEKLLLTNLVKRVVWGDLKIRRIEVQSKGDYLAMGCCYFTGVDQS